MAEFVKNRPYTGPVRAVVLDWAGTAVDYGSLGPVMVFMEVFRNRQVEVSSAEVRAHMGLMKKDHIRAIASDEAVSRRWTDVHGQPPGEADVKAMFVELEPLMASVIARYSDPIPGLDEAVAEFRRMDLKIGSTTGYTRPMMAVLVPRAASKGYHPDAMFCSSDVPAGRPCPWMCYLNAIQLGVYPQQAMVKIGDTIADVEEGLNAGMWTIGLSMTGNELGLSQTDARELPAEELEGRLAEIEKRFEDAGAHFVVPSIRDCPAIIDRINQRLANGEQPIS